MANLNYPGEIWPVTGTLVDSEGSSIAFIDVVTMSVRIIDERGTEITLTKAGGDITEGSTSNSYKYELSSGQTALFYRGKIIREITIEFPSSNVAGGTAKDVQCGTLLTLYSCQ